MRFEDAERRFPHCWICGKGIISYREQLFSMKFDSYLHESCLDNVLEKYSEPQDFPDDEFIILAREFKKPYFCLSCKGFGVQQEMNGSGTECGLCNGTGYNKWKRKNA